MNLNNWLKHIHSVHGVEMDLSLERVYEVANRLGLLNIAPFVITVGGTNGKGSTVAGLEAIYLAEGYRVGALTSPFLYQYNEYVRLQGIQANDEQFCSSFERIESARGMITLTPFEFTTLAAFDIFSRSNLDVWILEVGLGGRFDAVNALDADIAIITSIAIDHTEWLGDTREKIAFEKAGIFRSGHPAICGDTHPPQTLLDYAKKIRVPLFLQNKEFGYEKKSLTWQWWYKDWVIEDLPIPSLLLPNMANVLMAIHLSQKNLPICQKSIRKGLNSVTLPGRLQVVPGEINQIWDVSHNPAAAALLAQWLQDHPVSGTTRAVFSMLSDKDIKGTLEIMKNWIDEWHIADLKTKRAASLATLQEAFSAWPIFKVVCYETVEKAYESTLLKSKKNDRVIVFGSFHTVAAVKNLNPA